MYQYRRNEFSSCLKLYTHFLAQKKVLNYYVNIKVRIRKQNKNINMVTDIFKSDNKVCKRYLLVYLLKLISITSDNLSSEIKLCLNTEYSGMIGLHDF